MLLEQCAFQIWSWSIFDLKYSSRLSMVQDHTVLTVLEHMVLAISQGQNLKKSNLCTILHHTSRWTKGLATRERRSRSIQILSGLAKSRSPRLRLHVNCRSRFASVLRVEFEDAMLTQCNFYRILKHDTIWARPLLVHTCTYALIIVFKSAAQAADSAF